MPQVDKHDSNIGPTYNKQTMQQTAAKHASNITKKHVSPEG